jgi:hypothetical protein
MTCWGTSPSMLFITFPTERWDCVLGFCPTELSGLVIWCCWTTLLGLVPDMGLDRFVLSLTSFGSRCCSSRFSIILSIFERILSSLSSFSPLTKSFLWKRYLKCSVFSRRLFVVVVAFWMSFAISIISRSFLLIEWSVTASSSSTSYGTLRRWLG